MKKKWATALAALAWLGGHGYAQSPERIPSHPIRAAGDGKDAVSAPTVLSGGALDENGGNGGGHFSAGAALYFLQPVFNGGNPAFSVRTFVFDPVTFTDNSSFVRTDYTYNLDAAPAAWIGYETACGLGFRVSYFQYAQGSDAGAVAPDTLPANTRIEIFPATGAVAFFSGQPGESFQFQSHSDLNVLTWDFEVTQAWTPCNWLLLGSAGIRYAHLNQGVRNTTIQTQVFEDDDGRETFRVENASSHNFNGAGTTVAINAHRSLGHSGLGIYGLARGSLLFGTTKNSSFTRTLEDYNGIEVFHQETETSARNTDILTAGEIEIGADFSRNLGRARASAQVGFVGQTWIGGGNAISGAFAGERERRRDFGFGNSDFGNFGLFGLVLRAGVIY